jgi:hypothetical protein
MHRLNISLSPFGHSGWGGLFFRSLFSLTLTLVAIKQLFISNAASLTQMSTLRPVNVYIFFGLIEQCTHNFRGLSSFVRSAFVTLVKCRSASTHFNRDFGVSDPFYGISSSGLSRPKLSVFILVSDSLIFSRNLLMARMNAHQTTPLPPFSVELLRHIRRYGIHRRDVFHVQTLQSCAQLPRVYRRTCVSWKESPPILYF